MDEPLSNLDALNREAPRIGINLQALIKAWLHERLDGEASKRVVCMWHNPSHEIQGAASNAFGLTPFYPPVEKSD
ncbi:hypothetical protein H6A33_11505 [Collinsella tanakaei]|nr:hypothetical protein [Collinsella tanakaei]